MIYISCLMNTPGECTVDAITVSHAQILCKTQTTHKKAQTFGNSSSVILPRNEMTKWGWGGSSTVTDKRV